MNAWLLWQPVSDGSEKSNSGMKFVPFSWTTANTYLLLSTRLYCIAINILTEHHCNYTL